MSAQMDPRSGDPPTGDRPRSTGADGGRSAAVACSLLAGGVALLAHRHAGGMAPPVSGASVPAAAAPVVVQAISAAVRNLPVEVTGLLPTMPDRPADHEVDPAQFTAIGIAVVGGLCVSQGLTLDTTPVIHPWVEAGLARLRAGGRLTASPALARPVPAE